MKKYYDLDITNMDITEDFVKQLALFEPCGFKNEKPMFRLVVQNNTVSRMSNFPQHIRMKYNNFNLVGFGKGEYYYNLSVNSHKELIIELENTNKFNKDKISGFIKHINYSKLNTATKSEIISANYLAQLNYINCKSDYSNHTSVDFVN